MIRGVDKDSYGSIIFPAFTSTLKNKRFASTYASGLTVVGVMRVFTRRRAHPVRKSDPRFRRHENGRQDRIAFLPHRTKELLDAI